MQKISFLFVALGLALASLTASAHVDRSHFQCVGNSSQSCARDLRTGQCTHEWTGRDGGDALLQCRRWLGVESSRVDRRNYRCDGDTSRVCARDLRTGQCTHVWTSRDGGDPMFQCLNWLRGH